MPKKIIISTLAFAGLILISGCGKNTKQDITSNENISGNNNEAAVATNDAGDSRQSGNSINLNTCNVEKVSLPNYGDPGKRLKNCFVEYPGEPSRQDKSYYIVEDICGQFSQSFMENMLGAKLAKIEPPTIATLNNCSYYFDDKEYITLNLEYLAIENQKKGNEAMDRKVEKNAQIPMDNLVVWQEGELINTVYLILNPNKFISLRPSSGKTISNDKFLELAANVAAEIKGYK